MQLVHQSKPIVPRDRLIDLSLVCTVAGVKKSTIYAWLKDSASDFPRPVRLSSRMVRWSESAILQWVQNRINHAFDSYNVLTRIVEFLQSNPDEGVSAEDIAVKFDVNRKDLHAMLVVAINQELLICSRNRAGEYVYYLPNHSPASDPANSVAGMKQPRSTAAEGSL